MPGHVEPPPPQDPSPPTESGDLHEQVVALRRRTTILRAAVLLVLLAAVVTAVVTGALPDVDTVQDRVRSFGALAPLAYVVAYAVLVLFPVPASVLTIAGGALFGLAQGGVLALVGASLGAVLGYEIGRLLGRDAVARLTRGRLARVEQILDDHGLLAVLAIRLTPIFPFLVINYAGGLSNLSRRDYALGTVLGIIPGVVAYASVGAYGTEPMRLFLALGALVLLALGGAAVGRRILRHEGVDVDEVEAEELG